jgi:hypothetical protein
MSSGRRFHKPIFAFVSFYGLFCLTMLLPGQLWAGVGFQPVNPDELKMTGDPLAPGAPAIILYRQVDRDDNIHTPHEDNYLRIKILTEEGRKRGNVEIPFSKGVGNVVNVHARTIKPDGSIVDFDGKVYEKTVVKTRERSYVVKAFNLSAVEPGSIIEYFYTIDFPEYYIFDSHWILSEELFTRDGKFTLKPYANSDDPLHLRWTWNRLPAGSQPKIVGLHNDVNMEVHNVAAFQTEDYMPPDNELKSRVDFIYDEETETDPARYWKKIGKKRSGALESFVGKRKAMEEAVGQIVSPNDPPEVKLRKIYDRVQQIRNTSYEIEKTVQEQKRDKEKTAANVEDVWKRGYGTGVQLTWLFLALARAAGFEASGCWVSDRKQYFFNAQAMNSNQLDTNVVIVKVNGKDLYFDPGGAFTPYGMLMWSETGVTGLKLDSDGGSWIQTAVPDPSQSQVRREAKLKLSDNGDLEGTLTLTYTGLEAMDHRLDEQHEDAAARKKYLEDSVKEQIPAASDVELKNQPDWAATETPLVAVIDLKIPGWASSAGRRALLPVGIFSANEKHIFEHADRVYPIYFEYPYEKIDDVTVEIPAGWRVSSAPAPQQTGGERAVAYAMKVDNTNNTIHVIRKLDVAIVIMETKYYPALRNFFQVVKTGDEQQVLLQPGEISSSN